MSRARGENGSQRIHFGADDCKYAYIHSERVFECISPLLVAACRIQAYSPHRLGERPRRDSPTIWRRRRLWRPRQELSEKEHVNRALFARQNRRNLFCDALARGVIMTASALTPTSAITRFMLQASTLIAISVETLRGARCAHPAHENCSLTSQSQGG
jgi:hypothetical protein